MNKFGKLLVISGMVAALGLATSCGDSASGGASAPKKAPPIKMDLPWKTVKMQQGKELNIATLANESKMQFSDNSEAGAIAKAGDVLYIRADKSNAIMQAKLEGATLKVLKADFIKDISPRSFLTTDNKNLYYSSAKFGIYFSDPTGKTSLVTKNCITALVPIPDKNQGMTFINNNPVKLFELNQEKLGKEVRDVIPDYKTRNLLPTPGGLIYDENMIYFYGSDLEKETKWTVGKVVAYDLNGKQKFVLGGKHDPNRSPGYLAGAADVAVTRDYIFVFDMNIRLIHIFNKQDGKFIDRIDTDKLFDGQRGVHLMTYVDNNVLAIVRATKPTDPDKVFMLHL